MSSPPRILVLQNGARHDYSVPLALATHGMLAGFYTDACGNQGIGMMASFLAGVPVLGAPFKLLKNRRVPDEVLACTSSFPFTSMMSHAGSVQGDNSISSWLLGILMAWRGMGDADMVYSSMGWSPWFLRLARRRGLKVVTEFYVRPSLWRVHQEEYRLFPDWEAEMPYRRISGATKRRKDPFDFSDDLLVPTQAVKDDIIQEGAFPADKIHLVPYGIGQRFFEVENRPVAGQILFVGTCSLVKGIHYLAMAAEILRQTSGPVEPQVIAAGEVSDLVRRQPLCESIQFTGRVPRYEVNKLYETADILVFPTLSDSFGAVILEAMAAGIPVICSPYCAEVVEDGISGFVVEPRNTEALAAAISTLTHDRVLRGKMSVAARERAREYTWDRHAEVLTRTLKTIAR